MVQAHEEKKDIILEAAKKTFSIYGYKKSSISDIAQKAHMGKGTIYYYFESKEDILVETMDREHRIYHQKIINQLKEEKDYREKIKLFIEKPVKMLHDLAPILFKIINDAPNIFLEKIEKFRDEKLSESTKMLSEILEGGIKAGVFRDDLDVEAVANLIIRRFLLVDENFIINFNKETIEQVQKDNKLLSKLFLDGVVVRR